MRVRVCSRKVLQEDHAMCDRRTADVGRMYPRNTERVNLYIESSLVQNMNKGKRVHNVDPAQRKIRT